ncbi:Crp/Fnr family transcriptional regulator [Olivibacter domesticus]|uniref:Crp/Fnr family transcriptional regulator n=1 Tax=Olivibacter domesticus TaxID=407022 RepID=UPI001EE4B636|nr:Crp/Fnr family transcriptional regulator [Olivibacter domesticus]
MKKGKVLLNEGEKTNVSYFVSKGLLRAYTLDLNGKEHIIQFAPEDWWIGDRNSVYFNEPAVFNIDVLEDAEVVVITKAFMEQALDICPDFGKYNIYLLHNSIRHMQNRINKLLAATAEERYLDFIKLYPDLTLRIPQMMIASYLGVTPESLSRVRKALAQKHFRPNS